MTVAAAVDAACRSIVARADGTRLATRIAADARRPLMLRDGYVPLLVDYTAEDREAKGLRKLQPGQATRAPVHDTVLEAMDQERVLLLGGAAGSGKTTSLLHLAAHLAGATIGDGRWSMDGLTRPVPRNDAGTVAPERWSGPPSVPLFIEPSTSIEAALRRHGPIGALVLDGAVDASLLIDDAERLAADGSAWLAEAASLAARLPRLRIVVAADSDASDRWRVPRAFVRRRIAPLVAGQRAALQAAIRPDAPPGRSADPAVAANIALFTLAVEIGGTEETPTVVVDRWLADPANRHGIAVGQVVDGIPRDDEGDPRLRLPFLRRHLEARRWQALPLDRVAARYHADPAGGAGIVALLAGRLVADRRPLDALVGALMRHDGLASPAGTIDAVRIAADVPADCLDGTTRRSLYAALVPLVDDARLPTRWRAEAGRALATDGDPRDLDALVSIPAGPFTMGATVPPNSAPPHRVDLPAYRIGRYPVTNDRYRRFVEATGRAWRSTDGRLPHRSNAPAVDLTWRDARAYCDWLTGRWRDDRRIAAHERVRLPSEPEWERAARGTRTDGGLVYPWVGPWQEDHANDEDAGFNDTCSVGLFPLGRSADGCDDMAGQVWEWTTTLWGDDMATPRYAYPYAADGREDPDAPADVRRVLRGACFLSPREKANCVYRGSLEPDGFWRGNGFRVVVAGD